MWPQRTNQSRIKFKRRGREGGAPRNKQDERNLNTPFSNKTTNVLNFLTKRQTSRVDQKPGFIVLMHIRITPQPYVWKLPQGKVLKKDFPSK